jgi:hypothetical protein
MVIVEVAIKVPYIFFSGWGCKTAAGTASSFLQQWNLIRTYPPFRPQFFGSLEHSSVLQVLVNLTVISHS